MNSLAMGSDKEESDEAIEQERDLAASHDIVPADEEDEELEDEAEVEEEDRETDEIEEREDDRASKGSRSIGRCGRRDFRVPTLGIGCCQRSILNLKLQLSKRSLILPRAGFDFLARPLKRPGASFHHAWRSTEYRREETEVAGEGVAP